MLIDFKGFITILEVIADTVNKLRTRANRHHRRIKVLEDKIATLEKTIATSNIVDVDGFVDIKDDPTPVVPGVSNTDRSFVGYINTRPGFGAFNNWVPLYTAPESVETVRTTLVKALRDSVTRIEL